MNRLWRYAGRVPARTLIWFGAAAASLAFAVGRHWYDRHWAVWAPAPGAPPDGVAAIACCFWFAGGLWYVWMVNPFWRSGYREWLTLQTPWRPGLPLPNGRLAPHWEHLLPLMLAAATGWLCGLPAPWLWTPALAAIAGYLAGIASSLRAVGGREDLALVWALAAASAGACHHIGFVVGPLGAGVAFAALGVRNGLRQMAQSAPNTPLSKRMAAHPHDLLAPLPMPAPEWTRDIRTIMPMRRSSIDNWLIVVTVGWCWCCVLHGMAWIIPGFREALASRHGVRGRELLVLALPGFVAMAAAVIRAFLFFGRHGTPLWPLARLRLGRPILPRFDAALFGVMAPPAAALAAGQLLLLTTAPVEAAGALTLMVPLAVAIFTPPSLRQWHLNGGHRIGPPSSNAQRFVRTG